AMVLSPRRESARARHNGFRLCGDGLARVRARARHLVDVLQSRALARTPRRTRTDRRRAGGHLAAEARLDVAPVAFRLRDSGPVGRVRRMGRSDESTLEQGATRDDDRDDPDRVLWL